MSDQLKIFGSNGEAEACINEAILKVIGDTSSVQKEAVRGLSYEIVSFVAVVNMLREPLREHGLTIKLISSEIIKFDPVDHPKRGPGVHAIVKFTYRIGHQDCWYTASVLGEALEFADKAILKCGTAALKQLLMQTFLLGGDQTIDPDYENLAEAMKDPPKPAPPLPAKKTTQPLSNRPRHEQEDR